MSEENIAHENAAAQADAPYSDMGPGYANRGNAPYINRGNAPNMTNTGYGYQNYGGPAPRANYQPNYAIPAQGNYRGNYAPYGRGYASNYPYTPVYGGHYEDGYEHHYHHDDHDNHYDHPYNYGYSTYNMPPGMGRNRMYPQYHRGYRQYYNMPPGMGRNWMHHQYYHGQPYFDGYGPGEQGTWGFVRNWFAYNPVANWVRSPRGSNFLRGLGIATAGIILAPAVVKTLRPLAVQAVHGVMSIVGEVKGVVSDAREELEDIFADAKWENLGDKERKIQEGE